MSSSLGRTGASLRAVLEAFHEYYGEVTRTRERSRPSLHQFLSPGIRAAAELLRLAAAGTTVREVVGTILEKFPAGVNSRESLQADAKALRSARQKNVLDQSCEEVSNTLARALDQLSATENATSFENRQRPPKIWPKQRRLLQVLQLEDRMAERKVIRLVYEVQMGTTRESRRFKGRLRKLIHDTNRTLERLGLAKIVRETSRRGGIDSTLSWPYRDRIP